MHHSMVHRIRAEFFGTFRLAPIVGGVIAGNTYAVITGVNRAEIDIEGV